MKTFLQNQSGIIPNFPQMLSKHPGSFKILGNGLSLGAARQAKDAGCFIVIRTGGNWAVDDDSFIQRYADEASRLAGPFLQAGLCDLVEPPNEPVVQTVELAKLLNDRQIEYARIMKARGFTVGAYNFSVGNPDYPLWPYLWDGIRASDYWLLLHQYDAPRMDSDPVNRSLRHRTIRPLMPADIRENIRIGVTETGIDFGCIGQNLGGYQNMPQPPNDKRIIDEFLDQMTWYEMELAKDPEVLFLHLFGYGMLEPWVRLGFDIASIEEDWRAFGQWLQGGLVVVPPIHTVPPPNPHPEEPMEPTAAQTVASVPFLIKASEQTKYGPGGLGQPVYGEYPATGAGGEEWTCWIFLRGGLKVKVGNYADFSGVVLFNPTTGEHMAEPLPWPTAGSGEPPVIPPVPNPDPGTMLPYKFPNALTMIGAVGEEGQPTAGQPFYRLTGAAVRQGVSAFMVVTVIGLNGTPVIGAKVVNLFPDGNGEVLQTDGSGTARFQFGASSAFTQPGTGPFTVFVADDRAHKDEDKQVHWLSRNSDIIHSLGDFQGQHTEINIQVVAQPV